MATLDTLTVRIEADLKAFEPAMDRAEKKVRAFDRSAGASSAGVTKLSGSTQKLGITSLNSLKGLGRLNDAFVTLAKESLGLPPVMGKLIDVLGTFALGVGVMIPILAGLAAIGAAFAKITEKAREARAASREAREDLIKWNDLERTAGDMPLIQAQVASYNELWRIQENLAKARQQLADADRLTGAERLREIRLATAAIDKWSKAETAQAEIVRLANERLNQTRTERRVSQEESAARDAAAGMREEAGAAKDAAAALKIYNAALVASVEMGIASAAQVDEFQKLMSSWADAAVDASLGIEAQAEALQQLLAALKAVNREAARTGGRLSLQLTPSGVVTPVRPPSAQAEWDAANGVRPTAPSRVQMLTDNAQVGPAGQEIMQVAQAASAGLGPFALLIPVINSALEALEPVLTKIIAPLANVGAMLAQSVGPQLEFLAKMLRGLVVVVSYVNQAIGWLIRAIGKAINFLLPGNPANGMVRFGQGMIDASRAARDFRESVDAAAATMRNVPLTFDPNAAAYRVGMGETGRTAVPRGAGVNVVMNITQRDGENSVAFAERVVGALNRAASAGNPTARMILAGG